MRGAFFEDELPYQKELYAQTLHQLLMGFLDAEPGRYTGHLHYAASLEIAGKWHWPLPEDLTLNAHLLQELSPCKESQVKVSYQCREEVGFLFSESSKRSAKTAKADLVNGPIPDALEDLLDALSAVYTVFPDLWVDPALR